MKKLLLNNTITYEIDILVLVECINNNSIAASINSFSPYIDPSILDDSAFAEYEDFILNLLSLFADNGFEVLNQKYSPESDTSWYLTMYRKSNDVDYNNVKCIIRVRVSDHTLPLRDGETVQDALRRQWTWDDSDIQKNYKFPKTKDRQKWKAKQIIVDDYTSCPDYDAALTEIESRIISW